MRFAPRPELPFALFGALCLSPWIALNACSESDPAAGAPLLPSTEAGPEAHADVTIDAAPDDGAPPGIGKDAVSPDVPVIQNDAPVPVLEGGIVVFDPGVEVPGSALPAESSGAPAFRCDEAANQTCMRMLSYWPAPAPGTMQVKSWEFADTQTYALLGKGVFRVQGLFRVDGGNAPELRLVDHLTGALWTDTGQAGGQPLETWVDTWNLRYDGATVIEYKDDANYQTAVANPRQTGVRFMRATYDPGFELRWGDRLVGGVDNPSPTRTWADTFALASLDPEMSERTRSYADNTFGLVQVRNGVIVVGRKYDQVALVKVSQRGCVANTPCDPVPSDTSMWVIDYFYMAPGDGMIARVSYGPKTDSATGKFVLDGAGQFIFEPTFIELMTDLCTSVAPPSDSYDWQLAFADATLAHSPPPPSCQ